MILSAPPQDRKCSVITPLNYCIRPRAPAFHAVLTRATNLRNISERPRKRHVHSGILSVFAIYVNTFTSPSCETQTEKPHSHIFLLKLNFGRPSSESSWKAGSGPERRELLVRAILFFSQASMATGRFCVGVPWEFQELSKADNLSLASHQPFFIKSQD